MIDERTVAGRAVVIGAGTMGGGIAAQLANAGWSVTLLDVPAEGGADHSARSAAAAAGLERALKARPPLLFLPQLADRIAVGNTADDLHRLREADWIVEAVAERMDVKQDLLARIEAHAGPAAVVSSNTSGLSLAEMTAARSAAFRSRFLGSHFLNPPRYLKLLEVVPLADTDPDVARGFVRFAEQVLGHRVVIARDTPGFISTRIWIQHLVATMRLAVEQGMSVEQADYLTGALLGRPRSATFRMADIVGIDIVAAIAGNQYRALPDDPFREALQLPRIVLDTIAAGRLGEKAGGGFYRRAGREIFALDLVTGEYRPRMDAQIPEVEALLKRPLRERLGAMARERGSQWGAFVNSVLESLKTYVEYAGPHIASDTLAVDRVMRWGFQWELGPYEMEDWRSRSPAVGEAVGAAGLVREFATGRVLPLPAEPDYLSLAERKAAGGTLFDTADGALIDLGDGVACFELHTKLNTFSPDACAALNRAREAAERDFTAMVIATDGPNFSAGYNLKLLLTAALAGDFTAIDGMLRGVQQAFLGLKYSRVPIVAAPRGYTLGAGCECALHCAAMQAGPELAMGLPELSAGLVPGGGGLKELLARASAAGAGRRDAAVAAEQAFRQAVLNGTSGSAAEAASFGLLSAADGISRNADRQLYEAKQKALALAAGPYRPRVQADILVAGEAVLPALRARIAERLEAGQFSEYDAIIADRIATIITGGEGARPGAVPEEHLLTLERTALCALAWDPRTIARMQALLETGKPLRN